MKKLIFGIAGLAMLAVSAFAQLSIETVPTLTGGTNFVAATSTNTGYAIPITVTRAGNVSIQPILKLQGAGTSVVVMRVDRSVDGNTWEAAAHSLSVTMAGTAVATSVTQIACNGTAFYRISSIENPNATALTNILVKYSFKPGLE